MDINQKEQVECETGYFTVCVGGISESPLQQPGDSRFGYSTIVHKSCWDSSGSFSPKREEIFFSVSFAASTDARFPCLNFFSFTPSDRLSIDRCPSLWPLDPGAQL